METREEMSSGLGASPDDLGTIAGDIVGETLCGMEWDSLVYCDMSCERIYFSRRSFFSTLRRASSGKMILESERCAKRQTRGRSGDLIVKYLDVLDKRL